MHRLGDGQRGHRSQVEADDHRVAIGGAVRVGVVQADQLVRALGFLVIVQGARLVGVDVPDRRVGHLSGQAGRSQGVIERPRLSIHDDRVGICSHIARHQVLIPRAFEQGDRLLPGVRVEGAHDQKVRLAGAGRVARQPVDQRLRHLGTRGAIAPLSVSLIRVRAVGSLAAPVRQVGDHDREPLARGALLKGLRQALPQGRGSGGQMVRVEWRVYRRRRQANRGDRLGAIEQSDPGLARARRHAGLDKRIARAGRRAVVQPTHQVLDCALRVIAVVLERDQADHIRLECQERGEELGALALELGDRVRAAHGGKPSAQPIAVEIVGQVERGHAHPSTDRVRRGRARVGGAKGGRDHRVHAIGVGPLSPRPAVREHALDPLHAVPGAQGVSGAQPGAGVHDRVGVLQRAAVIQQDAIQVVGGLQSSGLQAGSHDLRRLQQSSEREQHLAIAPQAVVSADGQLLRQDDTHPLVALQVILTEQGKSEHDGGHPNPGPAHDHVRADLCQLGLAGVLAHRAAHAHHLAHTHVHRVGIDEQPLRSRRVAVHVAVLLLDEKPAQVGMLPVADHHPLDHHPGRAQHGRDGAAALNGVDQRSGIVARAGSSHAPKSARTAVVPTAWGAALTSTASTADAPGVQARSSVRRMTSRAVPHRLLTRIAIVPSFSWSGGLERPPHVGHPIRRLLIRGPCGTRGGACTSGCRASWRRPGFPG